MDGCADYKKEIWDGLESLQKGEELPEVLQDDLVGKIIAEKTREVFRALQDLKEKGLSEAVKDVALLKSATIFDVISAFENGDRHGLAWAVAGIYFSVTKTLLSNKIIEDIESRKISFCNSGGNYKGEYDAGCRIFVPSEVFGVSVALDIRWERKWIPPARRSGGVFAVFHYVRLIAADNVDVICRKEGRDELLELSRQFREQLREARANKT